MYWNTWKTKVKITKDPEWSWSEDKSHYLEPWVQPCIFQFQFYLLILFASQSQTLPFCFWDASELIQFIFAPLLQGRAASTSTWNYHCPAWVRLLLLCFLLFVRFCTTSPNCTSFWALKTERCKSSQWSCAQTMAKPLPPRLIPAKPAAATAASGPHTSHTSGPDTGYQISIGRLKLSHCKGA